MEYELEHWSLDRLIPYARNPRKNDHAVDKVAAAIREFGFRVPIVAKSDGTIVDGHLRYKAARKLGLDTVPIMLADDMTEAQIKAFRISVNKVAELAKWDDELLTLELKDLTDMEFNLDTIGFDDGELDALLTAMNGPQPTELNGDEDEVPEVKTQALSVLGDTWVLGRHRVRCGDSTSTTDVDALMQGKKADLVVTDPPYGVSYADKNAALNAATGGNRIEAKIENDHHKGESLKQFFLEAFGSMFSAMREGCPFYVFAPQGGEQMMMMMMMMSEVGLPVRHELIWVKNNHVLGRADYHYKHEPVLYGWKEGAGHPWYGERNKMSVWECNRPTSSKLHPTMKPVELVEIPINNSSRPSDVILDLFGGSGTTLMACEKLGRTARLMEISPAYVDVIIRRWQTATGRSAVLESTGQTFAEVEAERK